MPVQNLSDLACGLTRPVEDLPIGQPEGRTAVNRGIQVPFEIRVSPGRRIMKHPAVELDDEPFSVLGVAIADAER